MNNIKWKRYSVACLFLAPSLIGLAIFVLYPVVASFIYSFTKWDGITSMKFVGVDNYLKLIHDETFKISLLNNIRFTIVVVPLTIIISILLACAMNYKVKGIGIFRVLYFMPNITASFAIGVIWASIFTSTGPINTFLKLLGIENPPGWLTSSTWALPSVEMVSIWKGIGYFAIILLAGLQGIPKELYEAAEIDGANRWQRFIKITIPMLSPVIFFCSVMSMIGSFQVFDTVMAMTEGGPGRSTNVLVYNIYQTAFGNYEFGYASAMAYILFLLILIVTLIQFKGQKRWSNE